MRTGTEIGRQAVAWCSDHPLRALAGVVALVALGFLVARTRRTG